MNITDFLKDKKPLQENVLIDFEAYIDSLHIDEMQLSIEGNLSKEIKRLLLASHYSEFDLSFLEQSQTVFNNDISIRLPKYTVYALRENFHRSNILLYGKRAKKQIIGYANKDSIITQSYPNTISIHMLKAMGNEKSSELKKNRFFEVLTTDNTVKYWMEFNRDGELELYSELFAILDKNSRNEIVRSLKYFDKEKLYAVNEAKWYISYQPIVNVFAREPFPIIGLHEEKAYLITMASPNADIQRYLSIEEETKSQEKPGGKDEHN